MSRRNTMQRALVLQAVNALHNHATADEIYEVVSKEHPSISKGTVYRNLAILAEDGEIRKLEMTGGADRYDHITKPHYHIKCAICGNVWDYEAEVRNLETLVSNNNGFKVLDYEIMFRGYCPDCQKKMEGKKNE